MGCGNCSSSGNGLPSGCKNNGACGTHGCNKMEVFDWLNGIELPLGQKPFDIVEVRFKNNRKGYYRVPTNVELMTGDVVAVEVSPGHDVGVVSLSGELVRMQMVRKNVKDNYEIKKVFRKAKQEDIDKWQECRKSEQDVMMRARTIARSLNLEMKLSDVEFQGDRTKATFYYTAEDRVDFRELIKRFADEFRVRIEMRQIGYRYEAARLGGIGSCGRELCCSSWLNDYRAVSTSAARYQQLSLNPAKLAGQCGKLKCCLNYELDTYVEAIKDFPSVNIKLKLPKGIAVHMKTDIFKREMYYVYEGQYSEAPIALSVDAVKEIIHRNKQGLEVGDVEEFIVHEAVVEKETDFAQVVGQDSLTRFDKSKRKGQNTKGRNNNERRREARPNTASKTPNDQRPTRRDNDNRNRGPREGNRSNQSPRPPRNDQQNRTSSSGDKNVQKKSQPSNKPRGERRDDPPRGPKPDASTNSPIS
jgi:cell fate regulator YaaT (PSP1 superfamily)